MRTTSLTAWAFVGTLALRVTLYTDGVFRTLTGLVPDFDPTSATFVTDAAVGNAAARDGHLRITGHSVSAAALRSALEGGWRAEISLADLLAHPYLGKTAVSLEAITAAYAEDEAIAA